MVKPVCRKWFHNPEVVFDLTTSNIRNTEITCNDENGYRCSMEYPFAYNDGESCCAVPFEGVNYVDGRKCDGSPIGLESKCCLDDRTQTCY